LYRGFGGASLERRMNCGGFWAASSSNARH
jgi:hypothetical protein